VPGDLTAQDLLTATADQIRAAAIEWNRGYDEDCADILRGGEPIIKVTVCAASRSSSRLRAVLTPGLRTDDGFVEACDPLVKYLRVFDHRLGRIETARRAARYLGVRDAMVPVCYRAPGIS
jgi:hypothetical protein